MTLRHSQKAMKECIANLKVSINLYLKEKMPSLKTTQIYLKTNTNQTLAAYLEIYSWMRLIATMGSFNFHN